MARGTKTGITAKQLRDEELYGVALKLGTEPGQLTDDAINRKIYAAEDDYQRDLQIRFTRTRVFSDAQYRLNKPDSVLGLVAKDDAHPAGFDELTDIDEPAYDYTAGYWDDNRWGMVPLVTRPVKSVEQFVFTFAGARTAYRVPADWVRPARRFGYVQVYPTSGPAVLLTFTGWLLSAFAGSRSLPQSIFVDYTTGYSAAELERDHQDLLEGVRLRALLGMLGIISLGTAATIGGGGGQSSSLSLDGMSQSTSFGGKYGPYSGAIQFAQDQERAIRTRWKDKERGIIFSVLA